MQPPHTDELVWIFDLPAHVISKIFSYFSTSTLVPTTLINKHWNLTSPLFWSEITLPHRVPDSVKAKFISRSSSSLSSIHFKFYFDYLLAFKSLQACSRLKHLKIGEGGLTWIAGANASAQIEPIEKKARGIDNNNHDNNNNHNENDNNNNKNGNNNEQFASIVEDSEAKTLLAKATSAANQSAEAANESNLAVNAASLNVYHAQKALEQANALLATLPPSSVSTALLEAMQAVGKAIDAADKAAAAAALSANGAASAANAASVAAGTAGHVVRYHNTTYLVGAPSSPPSSSSSSSSSKRQNLEQSSLRASQIKTLHIISGRSPTKVIPEYKHLQLFSNLRTLVLDGGISPPHLKNVILSARNLKSLKINCSDSGEELLSLQYASTLESLSLNYFTQPKVDSICKIPSLTALHLIYTIHSPDIGLEQIAKSLPRIRSFHLFHPAFTVTAPTTANDSELGFLRSLRELTDLDVRLPNCNPELFGDLTITTLRKLGTTMVMPVSFVQRQPNLSHISLYSNHLAVNPNAKVLIPSPELIPQVKSVSLEGINVNQPLIDVLSKMHLFRLYISCEDISASDLTSLFSALSPSLAYLDLVVTFDVEPTTKLAFSLPKANPNLVISVTKRP